MLPTQRTALVEMTRWSCSIIASAPPAHSALTTACTSCWWTTKSSGSAPGGHAPPRGRRRASPADAGPRTGVRPAAEAISSARRSSFCVCRSPGASAAVLWSTCPCSSASATPGLVGAVLGPDQVGQVGPVGAQVLACEAVRAGGEERSRRRSADRRAPAQAPTRAGARVAPPRSGRCGPGPPADRPARSTLEDDPCHAVRTARTPAETTDRGDRMPESRVAARAPSPRRRRSRARRSPTPRWFVPVMVGLLIARPAVGRRVLHHRRPVPDPGHRPLEPRRRLRR